MPRYMVQAAYTAEAAAAFASKPQERATGIRALMERMGAQMDSLDYCLGDYDIVVTYTAPDDTTAVAIALAVLAPGHLRAYKTTKLLSQEEFLEASRKASGAGYQGPSQG